jgi:phenylpyruvate tautomerase PptA (4-oxalocrotonate tautomerase family)
MPQFTITGFRAALPAVRADLGTILRECAAETLGARPGTIALRFVALDAGDLQAPEGRSERYTVVELALFAGRPVEAKKAFYAAVYSRCAERLGLEPIDLELVLRDVPTHDWAVHGRPGDEL